MGKRGRRRARAVAPKIGADATPKEPQISASYGALDQLTGKQRAFVLAYTGLDGGTARWNGTRAAKAAGYSPTSAGWYAHELLRDPTVHGVIAEIISAMRAENIGRAQRAIEELSAAAFTRLDDIVELVGDQVRIRGDMHPDAWAAISEITRDDTGAIAKIKLVPKVPALLALLKAIGYMDTGSGAVNILQIADAKAGDTGEAKGVLTNEKIRQVQEILGIRGPLAIEPGPDSED